jgi:hypothetical protein
MRFLKPFSVGLFLFTACCDRLEIRTQDKDQYSLSKFSKKDFYLIGIAEHGMIEKRVPFNYSFGCPIISETSENYVVNFQTCLENTTSWEYTVVIDRESEKIVDIHVNQESR